MKNRAGDQRVKIGDRQPSKKITHQVLHAIRRRGHVDQVLTPINTDATRTEHPDVRVKGGW